MTECRAYLQLVMQLRGPGTQADDFNTDLEQSGTRCPAEDDRRLALTAVSRTRESFNVYNKLEDNIKDSNEILMTQP